MNNIFYWNPEENDTFQKADFSLLPDNNIQMSLYENGRKKERYMQDHISLSSLDLERIRGYEKVGYKLLWSSDLWPIPDKLHLLIQKYSDTFENYKDISHVKWSINRGMSFSWKQAMAVEWSEGRIFYFIKTAQLHPKIMEEITTIQAMLHKFLPQK